MPLGGRLLPGALEENHFDPDRPSDHLDHPQRKGLDYSVVFLLGLDYLTPKGSTEEQISNPVYVGIMRALHRLIIPYINQTPLIDRIQTALAG